MYGWNRLFPNLGGKTTAKTPKSKGTRSGVEAKLGNFWLRFLD